MRSRASACAGFTILELVVVMGILSGFLLMLVQMLTSGVNIFQEGERGQQMSDRRAVAARAVVDVIATMIGPGLQVSKARIPTTRLRLDWAALGLGAPVELAGIRVQVLRATVHLDREDHADLLRQRLRAEVASTDPAAAVNDQRLAAVLGSRPETGRAQMLLLPWPVGKDGVFMELRLALVVPEDQLDLMALESFAGEHLPRERVVAMTRVLASNLLHFEVRLWSQRTHDWRSEPGAGGPEYVWDSARAGSLLEGRSERDRFSLDLSEASLRDQRDDVYPRWVRVIMVLDDVDHPVAEAFLDEAMTVLSDVATVDRGEVIAGPGPGMVKIGSEWVGFKTYQGRRLLGLRRGLRGTKARNHRSGTRLRRGIEVVIDRPLHHGRDAQDG